MNVLATDTATEACSVALLCGDEVLSQFEIAPRQHHRLLFNMCRQLFAEAGITAAQLDAMVYGCGPGAFTGVRIATMFTQATALVHGLGVVAVSDLKALAQAALDRSETKQVMATLDARMGEIYCGNYYRDEHSQAQPAGEEKLIAPHASALSGFDGVICGNGVSVYPELADERIPILQDVLFPDAKTMLGIARNDIVAGRMVAAEQALPVYLRHPLRR